MRQKVLYLAGPTASGKTELSIGLAKKLNGEVVSCDSMQIYRNLDIGTAKPTLDEQQGIKHWMIDFIEPDREYSVYDYVRDATSIIDDIIGRGKTPIVVGGTGYYLSALIHKRIFNPSTESSAILSEIESEYESDNGPERLLLEIQEADPEHAAKLSQNDRKRIVRAVELLRTTGSTYSFPPESYMNPNADKVYFLNASKREILYDRINRRVGQMVLHGLLNEAKYVYDNKNAFKTASMAIGYKEFFPYFDGIRELDDCISDLKISTRHYAKRQLTWFRKENIIEILFDLMSLEDKIEYICSSFEKDRE